MTGGFGGSMGGAQGGKGKRPISVKFEIPYFTTSGIQVRYLKIIEPKVRTPNLLAVRLAFSLSSGHSLAERRCGLTVGYERSRCGLFGDRVDLVSYGLLVLPDYARERIRVQATRRTPNRPAAHAACPGPYAMRLSDLTTSLTSSRLVAIPFLALGAIYYSIGRYSCEVAGCAMTRLIWRCRVAGRMRCSLLCNIRSCGLLENQASAIEALVVPSIYGMQRRKYECYDDRDQ